MKLMRIEERPEFQEFWQCMHNWGFSVVKDDRVYENLHREIIFTREKSCVTIYMDKNAGNIDLKSNQYSGVLSNAPGVSVVDMDDLSTFCANLGLIEEILS